MSITINHNVGNSYNCENSNETMQNPISSLPDELVMEVFSYLSLTTLATTCHVRKKWERLVNKSILWKIAIYREIAFGNDKWAQCFGADVVKDEDNQEEFSSLPSDEFIEDCKKFKSIFPEKNVKDCLMLVRIPKTLNGELTLKSFGELAKKYLSDSDNDTGYGFIWPTIVHWMNDKRIKESHWVAMTGDILPESRHKSYDEQQKIVAELAEKFLINYEVPGILESVVCILSQYFFDSKTRLFSDNPATFTRCKEKIQGHQTLVGGFDTHINVYHNCDDSISIGIAALRKF